VNIQQEVCVCGVIVNYCCLQFLLPVLSIILVAIVVGTIFLPILKSPILTFSLAISLMFFELLYYGIDILLVTLFLSRLTRQR
jgi:hypothetical protein